MSEAIEQSDLQEGYKEVQLGPKTAVIPLEWEVRTVGDCSRYIAGTAFPKEYQGKSEGNYPFYKVSDMNSSRVWMSSANHYISEEDVKEVNAKIAPTGTVVFPKLGQALLTNKRRLLTQESIFDNNVAGLFGEDVTNKYLYYSLLKKDFGQFSNPGTVPSLNKSTIQSIPLATMPLKTY